MLRIEEIVGAMDDEFRYALDALSDERLSQLAADKSALRRLRPVGVSHAEALEMIAAIQTRRAEQRRKAEEAEKRKAARAAKRKIAPRRKKAAPTGASEPLPEPPEIPVAAVLPPPPPSPQLPAPAATGPAIRLPPPAADTPAIILPPPPVEAKKDGERPLSAQAAPPRSHPPRLALWLLAAALLGALILAVG